MNISVVNMFHLYSFRISHDILISAIKLSRRVADGPFSFSCFLEKSHFSIPRPGVECAALLYAWTGGSKRTIYPKNHENAKTTQTCGQGTFFSTALSVISEIERPRMV
jgi:hypothetical protein